MADEDIEGWAVRAAATGRIYYNLRCSLCHGWIDEAKWKEHWKRCQRMRSLLEKAKEWNKS